MTNENRFSRLVECVLIVLLAFGFALPASGGANAGYQLAPGDVVEMTITAPGETRYRATIGVDGNLTLPVAGTLAAAGLGIEDFRQRLLDVLAARLVRERAADGRDITTVIAPERVAVDVVEYRPVYMLGDVARPGALPFRPGLTVDQAIALAGGFDIVRFRMNNPFLEMENLKSENETLWLETVREQYTKARLEAEIADKDVIETAKIPQSPVPADVVAQIARLEGERLRARREAYQKTHQHYVEAIQKDGERVATLAEQQVTEKRGEALDEEELQRVTELLRRGQIAVTRVVDARRSSLLSASRVLQTVAQVNALERAQDETRLALRQLEDNHRLGLIEELQVSTGRLVNLQSQMQASVTKLAYVSGVRSQLVQDEGSPAPEIVIARQEGTSRSKITANGESELRPGDVIEVSLRRSLVLPGKPQAAPVR